MVQNPHLLAELEQRLAAAEPVDYQRNLAWYEAMVELAWKLGVWPPLGDPLEGIEVDIAWAKACRAVRDPNRSGSST